VSRERAVDDERRVVVALTPLGRALRRRAPAVHAEVACATQCTAAQRQALTRQLQALRSALSSPTDS
jgi:DNA-binding MarR family transcriptional regulator